MLNHILTPALLALGLIATRVHAQQTTPKWFASVGSGLQWGVYIVDDASGGTWDFDAGFAWRGTVERMVTDRMAVGVAFNYSRLPLTWSAIGNVPTSCTRCAADGTVTSYGAHLRYGGGPQAFHQVIEGFVGALRYGNFTRTDDGTPLEPSSNTDLAFGAGYGFGFTISRDWQLQLIQDALYSVHERSTQTLAGGRITRLYTTRLALRVGF